MVLREDQAKATYTQKVDFAKLRSELLSADSTEASTTRSSHERLTNDIAKLGSRLRDEVGRTQASVRLDLNLEKGRIREEANVQELKIKETETKIEMEVAGLREKLEGVKFQTLQWLMGVCTGTAGTLNPARILDKIANDSVNSFNFGSVEITNVEATAKWFMASTRNHNLSSNGCGPSTGQCDNSSAQSLNSRRSELQQRHSKKHYISQVRGFCISWFFIDI